MAEYAAAKGKLRLGGAEAGWPHGLAAGWALAARRVPEQRRPEADKGGGASAETGRDGTDGKGLPKSDEKKSLLELTPRCGGAATSKWITVYKYVPKLFRVESRSTLRGVALRGPEPQAGAAQPSHSPAQPGLALPAGPSAGKVLWDAVTLSSPGQQAAVPPSAPAAPAYPEPRG